MVMESESDAQTVRIHSLRQVSPLLLRHLHDGFALHHREDVHVVVGDFKGNHFCQSRLIAGVSPLRNIHVQSSRVESLDCLSPCDTQVEVIPGVHTVLHTIGSVMIGGERERSR